jgi:hypothetical protein
MKAYLYKAWSFVDLQHHHPQARTLLFYISRHMRANTHTHIHTIWKHTCIRSDPSLICNIIILVHWTYHSTFGQGAFLKRTTRATWQLGVAVCVVFSSTKSGCVRVHAKFVSYATWCATTRARWQLGVAVCVVYFVVAVCLCVRNLCLKLRGVTRRERRDNLE